MCVSLGVRLVINGMYLLGMVVIKSSGHKMSYQGI